MSEYKLGLCSVSFRNKTAEEILIAMKKCGLNFIEWGSDVHAPKDDIKRLEEIAELQKKYDVKCSSYGTYFRIGVTPEEELKGYIKAAKILGTDILRLWCGDKNSEDYSAGEKELLFGECKVAAKIAETEGVTLCMECHNNTYTNAKDSALELMRAVETKHFRMYWQPNQFKNEEENIQYAKQISPYTENIHVFNWKGNEKYPLADAKDIWKSYLSCFDDDKNLLLEFMPDDKIETLQGEADALKEITK